MMGMTVEQAVTYFDQAYNFVLLVAAFSVWLIYGDSSAIVAPVGLLLALWINREPPIDTRSYDYE